ncbi:MAG: isoprenyl transferase [Clostridia bacterium]|nr:isoprenyl transferase [Clostridia bacterium]
MAKAEQLNDLLARLDKKRLPAHIAIIMDGNGRWATRRHLPRSAGHKAGMEALRQAVELCSEIGIHILTVYAFSTENWRRPADEVGFLMRLFIQYLEGEVALMNEQGIRLGFLGSREALPAAVLLALAQAQKSTAQNERMLLNIAVNYGGRDELARAIRSLALKVRDGQFSPEHINEQVIGAALDTAGAPDPELMIRTSGELRISNFLIWQAAYSELYFSDKLWPDFNKRDLLTAILDFQGRNRRFGRTEQQMAKD